MARLIRVMISSRCSDRIDSASGTLNTLTLVRRAIKQKLERSKLLDKLIFEVWINEDSPPEEGSSNAWDICLEQVREADIVIVLYNGNAGWTKEPEGVGICHA